MTERQEDAGRMGVHATSTLLSGPPLYVPKGPWGPVGTMIAAVALTVLTLAVGTAAVFGLFGYFAGVTIDDLFDRNIDTVGIVASALMQLLSIAGVWWLAGWRGGNRREVLQIDGPVPSLADIGLAIAGQIAVLSLLLGALYLYDAPGLLANYKSDVAPYLAAMRDANARIFVPVLLFLAIVLAPLSEEFLFRGFLLSGLAKWRWGFWAPAVLSILLWTVLHAYSLTGTLTVVVYGLYFSWLLWRTGQLWLPLICHAFANVVAMVAVAYYAMKVGLG